MKTNEPRGLLSEKLVAEEQTLYVYDCLCKGSRTVSLEKQSRVGASGAAARGRAERLLHWQKVAAMAVKPGVFRSWGHRELATTEQLNTRNVARYTAATTSIVKDENFRETRCRTRCP